MRGNPCPRNNPTRGTGEGDLRAPSGRAPARALRASGVLVGFGRTRRRTGMAWMCGFLSARSLAPPPTTPLPPPSTSPRSAPLQLWTVDDARRLSGIPVPRRTKGRSGWSTDSTHSGLDSTARSSVSAARSKDSTAIFSARGPPVVGWLGRPHRQHPPTQMGYVRGRGTQDQLLRVVSKLLGWIDRRSFHAAMVALDLTKAFDSMWHEGLFLKLHRFGFSAKIRRLLRSYLTDRYMRVHAMGRVSLLHLILFGVPQGSILGPVLFILFMADLPPTPGVTIAQYADDTGLLVGSRSTDRISIMLNRALATVTHFFATWRLVVNAQKTQLTLFKNGAASHRAAHFSVQVNGVRIEPSRQLTYLGVILDRSLTLHQHAVKAAEKAAAARMVLAPLMSRHSSLEPATKLRLYTTCVRPILLYACPVWAGLLANPGWSRLQTQQNYSIKAALGMYSSESTAEAHCSCTVPYLHDTALSHAARYYEKVRQFSPHLLNDTHPRIRRFPQWWHAPRPPDDEDVDDPRPAAAAAPLQHPGRPIAPP